jgi:uncharacterized protein YdeI (YjbR/CyaY-like superfamily)
MDNMTESRDPRVDAYIAKSAEFAEPILVYLREVIHAACPDVVEDIKWGVPQFSYRGRLCGMAAFKQHCAFIFWHRGLVLPKVDGRRQTMSQLRRLTSIADLPPTKVLASYVSEAMRLNEEGVKQPRAAKPKKAALRVPAAFKTALSRNRKALYAFDKFPPSHKREYVEWILSAKTAETRDRRIAQAVKMIAEGKSRNWKYKK